MKEFEEVLKVKRSENNFLKRQRCCISGGYVLDDSTRKEENLVIMQEKLVDKAFWSIPKALLHWYAFLSIPSDLYYAQSSNSAWISVLLWPSLLLGLHVK